MNYREFESLRSFTLFSAVFSPLQGERITEKLFVFATGLFTIHPPSMPVSVSFGVPRLSRMDFHIITFLPTWQPLGIRVYFHEISAGLATSTLCQSHLFLPFSLPFPLIFSPHSLMAIETPRDIKAKPCDLIKIQFLSLSVSFSFLRGVFLKST